MIDTDEVVPLGPLGEYLDTTLGEGRGIPVEVTKIGQGRSNRTFRVTRGGRSYVMRVVRGWLEADVSAMAAQARGWCGA